MKLREPKGRYSTRRIVHDEEKSRQRAYNWYIEVMTDLNNNPNDRSHRDIEFMTEEEFFQKPKIGETQSSSKNPRLRSLGKNARGDSGKKETRKLRGSEASANTSSYLDGRKFIVDSGASFHLISKCNLTPREKKTIRKRVNRFTCKPPMELSKARTKPTYMSKDLNDEKITCIIVKDCPALISLGLICTENGYDYILKNDSCPYLQKDGGKKIYCHPLQNVPTIAPATSAEGDFGKVAEESKDDAERQGDGPSRATSASPDKAEKDQRAVQQRWRRLWQLLRQGWR